MSITDPDHLYTGPVNLIITPEMSEGTVFRSSTAG